MQRLLLILFALCLFTGTASAITVEIQPDRVVIRGPIQLHDLLNGAVFSLKPDGGSRRRIGRPLEQHRRSRHC